MKFQKPTSKLLAQLSTYAELLQTRVKPENKDFLVLQAMMPLADYMTRKADQHQHRFTSVTRDISVTERMHYRKTPLAAAMSETIIKLLIAVGSTMPPLHNLINTCGKQLPVGLTPQFDWSKSDRNIFNAVSTILTDLRTDNLSIALTIMKLISYAEYLGIPLESCFKANMLSYEIQLS